MPIPQNQHGQHNMLDLSHISSQQQSTFTYYATGNWQTWNKPRNAKFIQIFCLGAGGGGGHTATGPSGTTGAGGAGSGGIVRGIVPAFLLPDTFYIQVGKGGTGAKTSGTAGSAGGITYLSLNGTTSEQTLICKSSTAGAVGGQAQNGGAGGTVSVPALSAFGNLGLFTATVGVAGVAGGSNVGGAGVSQAALGTNIVTGGAGGGGKGAVAFGAGGNITAASAILTSTVLGGQTAGQDGNSGYGTLSPFCGTGGAGGAGLPGSSGTGGKGGNGYYGCGGGGGGGSTSTGAFGGDGGDGLVIITVIS